MRKIYCIHQTIVLEANRTTIKEKITK